jgi:hypothetical protein
MTELLPASPSPFCQAAGGCDRAPCFQARLEATGGHRKVRTRTELCAQHLGQAVQSLAAWARDQGLEGNVTVLAIEPPILGQTASAWSSRGLAFGSIPLSGWPDPPARAGVRTLARSAARISCLQEL